MVVASAVRHIDEVIGQIERSKSSTAGRFSPRGSTLLVRAGCPQCGGRRRGRRTRFDGKRTD